MWRGRRRHSPNRGTLDLKSPADERMWNKVSTYSWNDLNVSYDDAPEVTTHQHDVANEVRRLIVISVEESNGGFNHPIQYNRFPSIVR